MAIEFKLPDVGEGIAEGEIVKWLVAAGDEVVEHQSVVEVMTDKATVEIPAPTSGRIVELRAKPGDTVPVGSVLFVLEPAGSAKAAPPAAPPAALPAAGPARGTLTPPSKPAPAPATPAARAPAQPAAPAARSSAASPGGTGQVLDFKLPDVGEGIAEGEIVKWLVKVGDEVREHQSIVEVMTDKATVEVPAPAAGRILRLLAKEGETVPVGKVIFSLSTAAAPATSHAPAAPALAAMGGATSARTHPAAPAASPTHAPAKSRADDKVLAAPSARRVAREMGVDLAQVPGSGRGGIVRRADVEAFAQAGAAASVAAAPAPAASRAPAAPAAPVSFAAGPRETRTPFRGVRRKIAEAMRRSISTAAHFTVVEEVDVTDLVRLKDEAKAIGAESNVKVTFMPFIMKATAIALGKFPELNGHLDEASQEIVNYGYVDLGIATDTPNGLIVPVIREVQAKGILQLAAELAEMAERTRAGKVRPEELKGSTFSITNAGNIGGILATPIINFPDIAILGVHRIVKRPGVVEAPDGKGPDRIEVRQYMNFSCSVDHRLTDGANAARFLVHLKKLLESPGLMAL